MKQLQPDLAKLPRVLNYDADPASLPAPNRRRVTVLLIALGIGLVFASLLSAALGQMQIPVVEVIGSLCRKAGLGCGVEPVHPNADAALWEVRFPRVALAILVGSALATAGAIMQVCSEIRSPTPASSVSLRAPQLVQAS